MAHITDQFYKKRWGVFNHYLSEKKGENEDWNTCVEGFDTERLAKNLHEMGAGYYFITLMQATKDLCAPNRIFDEIAGTKPGEACTKRDLVEDLYQSLSKYDIDLYLYYTGDGPFKTEGINDKFGFREPRKNISMDFVKKWAAVLEEYAVRYGDKVKGWWIDGCYTDFFGYTNQLLKPYYDAIKKGNPNAIVAFNNGDAVKDEVKAGLARPRLVKLYQDEDYTAGEFLDFNYLPESAFVDGARSHMLIPLGVPEGAGDGWGSRGLKRSHAYIKDFVEKVHQIGGVVTIDIYVDKYGNFDEEQKKALTGI